VTNAQSSRAVLAGTMEDAVTRPAGHEETGALSNSPVEWDNEGRASRIVQPPQMNIEASPQSQGRRENAAAMTNLDIAQSKPHGQEVWDEKLLRAAQLGLSEELVEALAHGADAKKLDEHGYTPLMHACVAGSLACVEALIDVSDAKAKTAFGHTALMFAARSCPEAVERLIPLSSPRSLSRDGESALMAAIGAKQAQSARLLLPVSNLKQKNQDGLNALAQAVRAGEEEMVELLLDGSDLGARDAKGRDALMIAADMGRMALVQRLAPLSDPRAANEEGESAFLLALKGGHDAVALWLLPRSDIHAKNEYGMDALMLAAACCQPRLGLRELARGRIGDGSAFVAAQRHWRAKQKRSERAGRGRHPGQRRGDRVAARGGHEPLGRRRAIHAAALRRPLRQDRRREDFGEGQRPRRQSAPRPVGRGDGPLGGPGEMPR
jgi:hypothetical protein